MILFINFYQNLKYRIMNFFFEIIENVFKLHVINI